jgi:predicted glycosyltransferase
MSETQDQALPLRNGERTRRFLLYSHDGLGLGHVRRNVAIATALVDASEDASVLVLSGAQEVDGLPVPPRVSVAKLPGPHRADQKVLAAAVEIFRPEILLVDGDPFGPIDELGPALEIVRASGGQAVLGLPDVLGDAERVEVDWRGRGLFERIPEYFARVLVYGQPDVLNPVVDCEFPDALSNISSFCGYVVATEHEPERVVRRPERGPRVLATVGEGEEGLPVLASFIVAATGRGWDATVVPGLHCPHDRLEALHTLADEAGVRFRELDPNLLSQLRELDAVLCAGGYNTVVEAVASGVPTVCVPSVSSSDQSIRAHALARRGLIRVVDSDDLDPAVLRATIEKALRDGRRTGEPPLDLRGAFRAAHHLLDLVAQRPYAPAASAPNRVPELLAAATAAALAPENGEGAPADVRDEGQSGSENILLR